MATLAFVMMIGLIGSVWLMFRLANQGFPFEGSRDYECMEQFKPVADDSYAEAAEAIGISGDAPVADGIPAFFTVRPNWDEAPEWAMWAAQDEDGTLIFSERHPDNIVNSSVVGSFWSRIGIGQRSVVGPLSNKAPRNPNWRQAIEQRPAPLRERIAGMMEKPEMVIADCRPTEAKWSRAVEHLASLTPERDDCQLVSREELERLRRAYDVGVAYCKRPASQKNFERLAQAHGVEL